MENKQLIMDALEEFGNLQCPTCEAEVMWHEQFTEKDIEKWLDKREWMCQVCGADKEVWKETFGEEHVCHG